MFSASTTNNLIHCISQLETLLQGHDGHASAPDWRRCCQGLKIILCKQEDYAKLIIATQPFLQFFADNLQVMRACLEQLEAGNSEAQLATLEGIIFAITEEMAVLMREYCLRAGYATRSDEEREIMNFFETSGHWFVGDGTMVSDYYHVKLPALIPLNAADSTPGIHD